MTKTTDKADAQPDPPKHAEVSAADPVEAQKKLHDLLASMWEQRKSTVVDRLKVLETAVSELHASAGSSSRTTGIDMAHRLAGILGMFGLPHGTDLAREIEVTLSQDGPLEDAQMERVEKLTGELSALISQRALPSSR